ncbi:diguanylate cyclase domain-containing protein [Burkholderia sp. MSMB1459WGS]|uniref:diguanylate cyclase domain-containing protein n=1 Tax=Burkholderia sp. MSMB1459WGS TaxID=1637970 RepID=UPI00359C5F0F
MGCDERLDLPCLRHRDAHLEVSPVRRRIGTKHEPMTPASHSIFAAPHGADHRSRETCSVAMHRGMRDTCSETLADALRDSDVVARLGGDEFVVLLSAPIRRRRRARRTRDADARSAQCSRRTRLRDPFQRRARCVRSRTPLHRRRPARIGRSPDGRTQAARQDDRRMTADEPRRRGSAQPKPPRCRSAAVVQGRRFSFRKAAH